MLLELCLQIRFYNKYHIQNENEKDERILCQKYLLTCKNEIMNVQITILNYYYKYLQ